MNEITQEPLSVEQAAAYLKLKPATIYNLVFYGKLTAYKPGGKRLLFKVSDLNRYAYGDNTGGYSDRADVILNTAQKRKPRRKVRA